MNPTFTIASAQENSLPTHLFIELGWHGISLFTSDKRNTITALRCYHFPIDTSQEKLINHIDKIISADPLFKQEFEKVNLFYSFNESVLVPHELYDPATNADMLSLLYGDLQETVIRTDFVYRYNLHNIYKVLRSINTKFTALFPQTNYKHQYSLLLDVLKEESDYLYCILGTHHITVLLLKGARLQVIQTFNYKIPEDVSYHLLRICQSFDVDIEKHSLHLSGMIEADSNLYKELHKYFLTIELDTLPGNFEYIEEIKNYPPHFFSHLFAIAACV